MKASYPLLILLPLLAACGQQPGDDAQSDDERVVLVEVDGTPVTLAMLERTMEARGVDEDDHERMRELLDELIRMQVVANAAREEGLPAESDVQAELQLAEVQTLYRNYINRAQRAEPVSDADIRDVYEAQLEQSGDTQYRIEIIAHAEQAPVLRAIRRIGEGEVDYGEVREEAESAGLRVEQPGWIDRSQVPEDFAVALEETQPGDIVPQPLEGGGSWHLVRLLDTRPIETPAIEEVREGIARTLLQRQREALIDSLFDQAEITPMLPLEEADPEAGQ